MYSLKSKKFLCLNYHLTGQSLNISLFSELHVLREHFLRAVHASPVFSDWIAGGRERRLSETIRNLLLANNCAAVYDHRSSAAEAAEGLHRLQQIAHDDTHPLSAHLALLLPPSYFPWQTVGCGRPLCGKIECEPNRLQWRGLVSAIRHYQRHERAYPAYRGLKQANPRGYWPNDEFNRLTAGWSIINSKHHFNY